MSLHEQVSVVIATCAGGGGARGRKDKLEIIKKGRSRVGHWVQDTRCYQYLVCTVQCSTTKITSDQRTHRSAKQGGEISCGRRAGWMWLSGGGARNALRKGSQGTFRVQVLVQVLVQVQAQVQIVTRARLTRL